MRVIGADGELDDDDEELDEDELEDGSDPFATSRSRPGVVTGRRQNASMGRLGEDERSELARLRSENARLRAVAGLEGRREEPATVGDLLDVNTVQADLIRDEVARLVDEQADEFCDRIAERVEERLLDTGALEGDEESNGGEAGNGRSSRRRRGQGGKRKRPGRKRGHMYRTADGSVYVWDRASEPDVVTDSEFVEPT